MIKSGPDRLAVSPERTGNECEHRQAERGGDRIVAAEDSLVAKVTEPQLSDLGSRYLDLWRRMAKELAERLRERNRFVSVVYAVGVDQPTVRNPWQ